MCLHVLITALSVVYICRYFFNIFQSFSYFFLFAFRFVLSVLTCMFEKAWILLRVRRHILIYRKFLRTWLLFTFILTRTFHYGCTDINCKARSQNCELQLVASSCPSLRPPVCLSVRPSIWNNTVPTGRNFREIWYIYIYIFFFFGKRSRKYTFP